MRVWLKREAMPSPAELTSLAGDELYFEIV